MFKNPYMDEILQIDMQSIYAGRDRKRLVRKYSWGIPMEWMLDVIKEYNKPVIEMGAGSGYWKYLAEQKDIMWSSYDIKPYNNQWVDAQWSHVASSDPSILSNIDTTNSLLFICWGYMNNMSYESLTWFKGDIHVRMGESKYGCTDSDEYFDLLAQEWDEVDIGTRDQMRYDGMYDYFEVYKRKK